MLMISMLVLCFLMFMFSVCLYLRMGNLIDTVNELISFNNCTNVSEREHKQLISSRYSEIKICVMEIEEKLKNRTNLILDQISDMRRTNLKKEDFETLYELLRREKILIENDEEKKEKKKWHKFEMAFGGKEEKE